MKTLQNKIDFKLIISVENANPNGDPLDGNRPRQDYEGYGEISDVCIKRKIRNRLQDMGERIFVQSDDRCDDGFDSLRNRADGNAALKAVSNGKKTDRDKYAQTACAEWIDVRSFGQVFAFKDGVSVGVRGPVSIRQAVSVSPVDVISMQITKSVNGESGKDGGRSSDTMGLKHRVAFGVYVINGSINCQLAEKTGFSEEDAEKIKEALRTLFENDCSSARPEGSMEVQRLFWWVHEGKTPKYSSAKVQRSVHITKRENVDIPKSFADYEVTVDTLENVMLEEPSV